MDTTTTTSWDDWAQGFRSDGMPNMNCPGQDPTSPFFQTLKDSKQWLDPSNPKTALPNNSQFKCYDGWSQLNQVQPAPYDGMYKFPSVTKTDPASGRRGGHELHRSRNNPDASEPAARHPDAARRQVRGRSRRAARATSWSRKRTRTSCSATSTSRR